MFNDGAVEVRRQAAGAFGEIEDVSCRGSLARAQDGDWRISKTAAWALGEIEDPSTIAALRAAAGDANGEVRRAIAQALRELGDRRQQFRN